MTSSKVMPDSAARRVRTNVRRVAFGATLLALVVYVLACLVADLVFLTHFEDVADTRLADRLIEIARSAPSNGPKGVIGTYVTATPGDFDDAPVVVWWIPRGAARVVGLVANAPALPRRAWAVGAPTDMTVAGHEFRLSGRELTSGRLVAGTSAQDSRTALSTLLVIEASLGPIVLLALYGAAWIIGRRAALPVERARQRQLEFTADASHELRTPLSVIESEIGLALNTDRAPEAYRSALERVGGESKRLRDIVDDLLWLARLDALPAEPPTEEVDLSSVARVCTSRFAAVAAQRGLSISLAEVTEDPAIVRAPPEWLDRLASVLIDNACRYADEGGLVAVAVTVEHDRVVLGVEDSGPGIAEDERDNIFRRFHRVSAAPGGAGLGLSIADAIVDATGGDWFVDRGVLGGARIEVSWPAAPSWKRPDRAH